MKITAFWTVNLCHLAEISNSSGSSNLKMDAAGTFQNTDTYLHGHTVKGKVVPVLN
jgi:hypothetical protein